MSGATDTFGSNAASGVMLAVLGGIATLSGLIVVMVYQLTLPRIEANQRALIQRSVFQVLPEARSRRDFTLTEAGRLVAGQKPGGITLYAGYDRDGRLAGVAAEASARGYQDVIRILYGYSPECACITGMQVLRSTETPGLGDRIGKDPVFLANFEALDAHLNGQGTGLRHAIVTVRHGTKTEPWQIDAISGATVSSEAVGRALNASAQHLLPHLAPHVDRLREPPEPEGQAEAGAP